MPNYDNHTKHYLEIRGRECIKIFCCILLIIIGILLLIVGVYTEENEFIAPMKISGFSLVSIGIVGVIGFSIPLWLMSCSKSNKYDRHIIVDWTSDTALPLVDVPPTTMTTIYAANITPTDRLLFSNSVVNSLPKWPQDSQVIELPPSYKDVYPYPPLHYSHTRL